MICDSDVVLRDMDMLERNMALLSNRAIGNVRCGFGPLAVALVLTDLLDAVARDHGGRHVQTRLGDVAELQALLRKELDFAVLAHVLMEDRPDFSFRRIGQIRLGALVRRDHPRAGRTVIQDEAAVFPVIGGSGSSKNYAPTIACDNFEVARTVALASDAICVAAESLADDRFALVLGLGIAQPLVMASLALRTLSPAALLLIDLLVDTQHSLSTN